MPAQPARNWKPIADAKPHPGPVLLRIPLEPGVDLPAGARPGVRITVDYFSIGHNCWRESNAAVVAPIYPKFLCEIPKFDVGEMTDA